jgi:signal transduction histidine kinase
MTKTQVLELKHRSPLGLLIAGFLVLFVAISVLILNILGQAKHDQVHTATTELMFSEGSELTRFLADMPLWEQTNGVALAWLRLPFLVDGLHKAHSGLQYLEVSRDGVTLFHRQVGDPVPAGSLIAAAAGAPSVRAEDDAPVTITRELLDLFGESVPVIVFKQNVRHANGSRMQVEIGMRAESVEVREQSSMQAVRWILRLAVLILILAALFSITVTIIAVKRDRRMEKRQRQEEHLLFSGMVANSIVHDFRNPMSAVRLDAQMLEREAQRSEGARPARLIELSGRIARTLERMDSVFKEFLFLSRPATAANARLDLCRCVRECAETLTSRFENAKLHVAFNLPQAPALVQASEPPLRRAIINVLQNAIQHAPAESTIDIQISDMGNPRNWTLDICDRGPGIPPGMREAVFEMFITTRPEGTGLGLFMARAAIANTGGTILALGRPGGGAVIRITIPKLADPEPPDPAKGSTTCSPNS